MKLVFRVLTREPKVFFTILVKGLMSIYIPFLICTYALYSGLYETGISEKLNLPELSFSEVSVVFIMFQVVLKGEIWISEMHIALRKILNI